MGSFALKGTLSRGFAVFSFIRCGNLYPVPLLIPKMLKWTNRNISNEWWLREQTIMNFWQFFQGMALEFEKTGLFFQISIHFHPCHANNKWVRCSDKVLGSKTASLFLGFHWCSNIFRHCKMTPKYRDSAPWNLHFRVNSLFHHLCSKCYAARGAAKKRKIRFLILSDLRVLKETHPCLRKSKIEIWKRILRFFTRQINPRSLGSRYFKGTEESTLEVDSSVPKDLGLICLIISHENSLRKNYSTGEITI